MVHALKVTAQHLCLIIGLKASLDQLVLLIVGFSRFGSFLGLWGLQTSAANLGVVLLERGCFALRTTKEGLYGGGNIGDSGYF